VKQQHITTTLSLTGKRFSLYTAQASAKAPYGTRQHHCVDLVLFFSCHPQNMASTLGCVGYDHPSVAVSLGNLAA